MTVTTSIQADVLISMTVNETLTGDAITDQTIVHAGYNRLLANLTSTSAIPVTQGPMHDYALVGGTLTLDLRALTNTIGETIDCALLKLQGLIFVNPAANAAMTISGEGANGYSIGSAFTVPAASGGYDVTFCLVAPEVLADVSASDQYLVITGTGTETFKLGLLFG